MVEKVTDTYPFYQNLNGGPGSGRRPEGGKAIIYPANSKSRFTVVKTKDGMEHAFTDPKIAEKFANDHDADVKGTEGKARSYHEQDSKSDAWKSNSPTTKGDPRNRQTGASPKELKEWRAKNK